MDNCYDLNSFQIKLEETELIIKNEPEEGAIENGSLDIIYDKSFPTPDINDQLLNTQVEVVPSICRIEDSNNIQAYQMKFEMKVEDYTIRETAIAEDTLKSKRNVGNYDFDALEFKLEHEEVIIKDEPEEVIENTSSLEIIQLDTFPVTLGIRDRIANTQIKVDPSICRTEDLLKICTCAVEVIMIPQHVFTIKIGQYRGSKLHNIGEANYDDECFTDNSNLKSHMLIHKGLKPVKCQQCDQCFTRSSHLKSHMLIHKGLKPFKCLQCNICFTQNGNLKRHMLIHKGLKPFKCQQCNKCFTVNSHLKSHILIHKGLKPFKCQQCNKCFTQNSNLNRHMLIHKGLKPFKCHQCNKCFTENGNLKRHKRLKCEEAA